MAIIAKAKNNRVLPSPGLHNGVCVDVHNLGVEKMPWGPKEKVLLVWEIDEEHPDFDGPFRVNRKYTLSLNEKASLRKISKAGAARGLRRKKRQGSTSRP